jgi:glycosyltransferase involved in cell wall biosynthesis
VIPELPAISIIVIGKNEAANLHNTFSAIKSLDYPGELIELIYVDSGSKDNSVEIAEKYCNKVFVEPDWPTAARNRNRGLIESSHDCCHFMDGDIVMDSNYLKAAIKKILEGDVQAVFGYLEEKSNKGLSRILLHDYRNRTPGYISAPGAGGTFLKKALIDVNGWDERIPRGEEMEIGDRLLEKGYKIWYLDQKMGVHDFGMTNIFKFFRKQSAEGRSIGQVSQVPVNSKFYNRIRLLAKRNIFFHFAILGIILLSLALLNPWIFPATLMLYVVFLFVKHVLIRGHRNWDTILYHYLKNLTKSCELYGYLTFLLRFRRMPENKKQALFNRMNILEEMKSRKL